jgi:predicted membrane-bound spermidine synthase
MADGRDRIDRLRGALVFGVVVLFAAMIGFLEELPADATAEIHTAVAILVALAVVGGLMLMSAEVRTFVRRAVHGPPRPLQLDDDEQGPIVLEIAERSDGARL